MCPGTCEAELQPWPRDPRAPASPMDFASVQVLKQPLKVTTASWFWISWNAKSLCFIKVAIVTQEIILNSYRSLGPSLSFPVNNQRQTKTKSTYISLDTHSYTDIIFSSKASTCLPCPWSMSLNTLTSAFFSTYRTIIKSRFSTWKLTELL